MRPQVWPGPQEPTYQVQTVFSPQLEDAFQREFASFEDAATKSTKAASKQTQAYSKPDQGLQASPRAREENHVNAQNKEQRQQAEQVGLNEDDSATKDDMTNSNIENDELSRTAGQLLDSVGDNQSQKFQNSSFLALMRRLRNKEVTVSGDKMVEMQGNGDAGKSAEDAVAI